MRTRPVEQPGVLGPPTGLSGEARRRFNEIIAQEFVTFDRAEWLYEVVGSRSGRTLKSCWAVSTYLGDIYCFRVSRDVEELFREVTASEAALTLGVPGASLAAVINPNALAVGPLRFIRHGVVNVIRWLRGSRRVRLLTTEEKALLRSCRGSGGFYEQAGMWLAFSLLFGVSGADPVAVPEEGRMALADLVGSFESSGVECFEWLGEFLAIDPRERAAQLAEVRDGYRLLQARHLERRSQLERDWQESGAYECAREYRSPYSDTPADEVIDVLRTVLN